MFEQEMKTFEAELQLTEQELDKLQERLSQLPDVATVREAIARLKDPVKYNSAVPKKVSKAAPAAEKPKRATRRKKSEMLEFRAQIKSVCQLLLKRKSTFSTKQVLNALVGQGLDANNANAQIVRGTLKSFATQGWLKQDSASTWSVVRDDVE